MNERAGTKALRVLVLRSLEERRRSIIIWGFSLGAVSLAYVFLFPAFRSSLNQYLSSLPEAYLRVFGISEGEMTIQGWLALEMFNLVAPLALPFFPIVLGARVVAGAEERRSLDLLLGLPIPRWHLIAGSCLAMMGGLLAVVTVMGILTWLGAFFSGVDLPLRDISAAVFNLWPFSLFFGTLALLCSTVVRKGAVAVTIPAVVLVSMYVLNALGAAVEDFRGAQKLSLFYYYGSAIQEGIRWRNFGVTLFLALLLAALAVLAFNRRDIHT